MEVVSGSRKSLVCDPGGSVGVGVVLLGVGRFGSLVGSAWGCTWGCWIFRQVACRVVTVCTGRVVLGRIAVVCVALRCLDCAAWQCRRVGCWAAGLPVSRAGWG